MVVAKRRKLEDRSHQEECWLNLEAARSRGAKKALVIMASGLGKTVMAIIDAKRFIEEHGGRVLCLCHRNDILDQLKREFEEVMEVLEGEYSFGMYNGNEKRNVENGEKVDFLFASFQTMAKDYRRNKFDRDEFAYIIVDEAHHAPARTFYQTLKYFTPKFLLGMTATPDRKDKADLNAIFGETVFDIRFAEAIARGLLTKPKVRLLMDEVAKLGEIYWKEAKRKISASELNKRMFAAVRDKAIADTIREELAMANVSDLRMVVFCRGVKHAENIAALIDGAVLFHSYEHRLPREDAKKNLQAFRDGTAKTIVVIDKFNEGIDVPEINVIVNLRQLGSRIPAEQQLGRGLRLWPGKDFVLVLDFVANCERIKMYWEMDQALKEARKVHPDELKRRGGGGGGSEDVEGLDITTNVPWFEKKDLELVVGMTRRYTREELIAQLQRKAEELGRTPTMGDVDNDSAMADVNTFIAHFGSWNNALIAAGLEINNRSYTDEELICQLQRKYAELGRAPIAVEVDADASMASSNTFISHFGTWNKALIAAGLDPNTQNYTKEDLLARYTAKAVALGRALSQDEINEDEDMASASTYAKFFGSLTALAKLVGVAPVIMPRYSRLQLIEQLKVKYAQLGRCPMRKEIDADENMADSATFVKEFGSINNALIEAGLRLPKTLKPEKQYYRATPTNWTKEQLEDQMLRKIEANGGKMPTKHEVDADKNMASANTFINMYGGKWNCVVKEFGGKIRKRNFNLNDLIRQVADIYGATGKLPTKREFNANRDTACVSTVVKICGSYSNLIAMFVEKNLK